MNINKIFSNRIVKQNALFWGIALPIVFISKCSYKDETNKLKEEINQYKSEILAKDSARYNRTIEEEGPRPTIRYRKVLWEKEYNAMNDSLKKDSLLKDVAQRAYFEGMQAVRDSLKEAK